MVGAIGFEIAGATTATVRVSNATCVRTISVPMSGIGTPTPPDTPNCRSVENITIRIDEPMQYPDWYWACNPDNIFVNPDDVICKPVGPILHLEPYGYVIDATVEIFLDSGLVERVWRQYWYSRWGPVEVINAPMATAAYYWNDAEPVGLAFEIFGATEALIRITTPEGCVSTISVPVSGVGIEGWPT